jgi:hypothetical protein
VELLNNMVFIIGSIVYVGGVIITFKFLFDVRINPFHVIGASLFWPITVPISFVWAWWIVYQETKKQAFINSFTSEEREQILAKAKELGL